ncbi:DNA-3-methyladenine glycosylase family protein [Sphingosinicella microcystinivorans]|uniref:DNA-3-methyladenine glycosylase family protein n=1 Tax=Sphingosinicella microcystinivorans TaxID=335406 RepID=UPI0022F3B84F|nr:DNA-3-methyladenine glycosylase 2 family protein [Sphingosinicella microcystinivorans]WBX82730.1 DNA-3-methyladenine glycosylase 2 family protein [Sphingosinicella microcystinivorans]
MGLSAERLREGMDAIAALDEHVAAALGRAGYPEPRIRAQGYETLLRTIVGQQVSVGAANSIWGKLEAAIGDIADPRALLARSFEDLRGAGLSRQKIGYAQSLAELSASGAIDFANLPADDEEAIALLSAVKGIGRWSAEIYLLFAEERPDIWPAGDLAVQAELGRIKGLPKRPTEREAREIAELWRPHRGAAAIFMWHHYKTSVL